MKLYRNLCTKCEHFQQFASKLFEDEDFEEKNGEDNFDKERWKRDILFLLTPYALIAENQFLLQFLVNKHQAHLREPEAFLWSLMPHYEYQIFQKAVDCVGKSLPTSKYPSWFGHFRNNCYPTTAIGLRKHLARDKGFFKLLCDMLLESLNHLKSYPKTNCQSVTFFFASSMLAAFDGAKTLGEHHARGIIQVRT